MRSSTLAFCVLTTLLPVVTMGQTGEWQQRVAYEMDIRMNPEKHQFTGNQTVTLWNNSPDTLRHVFYHLYFNAFQPTSMMAERNRHLPDPDSRMLPRLFELTEEEIGYHKVTKLTQDGSPVPFEVFDTVLKVTLNQPIPPGNSSTFGMEFNSQVPLQTRRNGRDSRDGVDYSMAQWYPKMANYDQRGWHADPYIGREFYAPFGTFDVKITIPSEFTLGGTGVIQNPNEVGHGYGTPASNPGEHLTWHFKAENVHDFAWVADTEYLHKIARMEDGRPIHVLYLPKDAETWEAFVPIAPTILAGIADQFGPYPHPQFTVATAGDGGMEYPMIIFNSGRRSLNSLIGVTIHEGAHQWFYSMMGNNEADFAWMDEGFTSYATTEVGAKLFANDDDPSHQGAFMSVWASRQQGWAEPFSTPSDWFDRNSAYGVASYSGGEIIAEMLGYVISQELRDTFFKRYYEAFRFKHPEPHDVELIAEKVSGLQLDWFFHQWLNTTWTNDYAVKGLSSTRSGSGWKTTVSLARLGRATMPIDLRLTLADGTEHWATIPLSEMMGNKPVPADWTIANAWPWTDPAYTLELNLPQRAVLAEIDPNGGMLDDNRLNNSSKAISTTVSFAGPPSPSLSRYGLGWAPFATYSHQFGVGAGVKASGAYLMNNHLMDAEVTIFTTKPGDFEVDGAADVLALINYDLSYERAVPALGIGTRLGAGVANHLGIVENYVQLTRPVSPRLGTGTGSVLARIQHQNRINDTAFQGTSETAWNTSDLFSAVLAYRQQDVQDFIEFSAEAGSASGTGLPFSSGLMFRAKAQKQVQLGKQSSGLFRLSYATGNRRLVEQKWQVAGSSDLETQWRSPSYRSLAGIFENPVTDARLFAFSGVGPVGYLWKESARSARPSVSTLFSGSLLLDSGSIFSSPMLSPLTMQLFTGAAISTNESMDELIADGGAAVTFDVGQLSSRKKWAQLSDVLSGMQVTARFPLWVSHPERIHLDEKNFAFRWLLGIETGF